MPTIGEELKAAREAKGLSLTEIAEKTRISHTFLKALEEDDYSVIPGEVFVVGFLRTYSKELGLNVKDVMARYRELFPQKEVQTPEGGEVQHHPKPSLISISRRRHPSGAEKPGKKKNPIYLIIIGGIILGAAITGIMLLLTPKVKPLELQPPSPPAAFRNAPVPPVQTPTTTALKNATSFKPHTADAPQVQKPVQKTGPLLLKLFAAADSYYSYRADKSRRMNGTLKKGGVLEIKADDEIVLTLGNGGGVTAELNGKKMGPFGKPAEVVSGILFTKENL
ncbi:MAG: helix-turn-helix domain-containing protein [Nitrospirota bacterium]